ncbi:MAG: sodium:solute symporter family protein [Lachnospiraceae bacterium]
MIDIVVILVYFAFLIAIGWIFRTFSSSTSDYFRGGGKMLWWMVGATAFMTQFSAWTFTGAAGKAFTDGFAVLAVFFGNAVGYFFNYLFFAAKSRQMRVITPIEGVRLRFGKVNEQAFTLASLPISVIQAGIWLNGLAVFATAVFNIDMNLTIIVTGSIVVLMSVTGGAWAVIASDFLQMVIIMAVSFVATVVAVIKAGGVGEIFANGLPEGIVTGSDYNFMWLFWAWVLCSFVKQFLSTNNMIDSYRYMCAKDTKNAKKAALLACVLMFVGPMLWFIPAWFVSAYHPDTAAWGLDTLGSSITDATYFIFVREELPVGMIGLMMSAMFAATMSSMDSALNKNSGIIIRDVYKVFINKNADEEKMLKLGKVMTLFFGLIIIIVGLFINSLENTSLFNVTTSVGSLLALPMMVPLLLGFFVKKTPDWAGWGTLLVGFSVSYFIANICTIDMASNFLGISLTAAEYSDMKSLTMGVVLHACITAPFFLLSQLFFKGYSENRQKEVDLFFSNTSTPVVVDEDDVAVIESDNKQRATLGKLLSVAGIMIMLMFLIPNEFNSRFVFIAVGGVVFIAGFGLIKSSLPKKK